VAAIPEVRAALLQFQKDFARREGGAVLDGRDIGTVVCPEAEAKLFVTASAEARAGRRHAEHLAAGEASDLSTVLGDVRARDERDAGRAHAPLRAAPDAVTIDTSHLGIEEAVAAALRAVRERLGR
jgi:cytidylate kinase